MMSSSTSIFSTSWRTYGTISASTLASVQKRERKHQNLGENLDESPSPPPLDRKANILRLTNLGLMGLVITGFGMCGSLFAPFFPTEAARRGVSATTVGLIFSSFTLVMFIGSLASGLLVKTLGLHFMIWSGTLLAGGSTVLFGLLDRAPPGDSYVTLCFIVRLVEGVGGSLYNTAAFSIVAELYPHHIATNYAILEGANGIGRMIGPSLGGALFKAGGFPLPFYVVGAILLVFGFISQAALRCTMPPDVKTGDNENKADSKKEEPKSLSWSHFYRVSPDIWILTITLSAASILVGFPQPTISLYFEQLGLIDAFTVGLVFLAVGVVYMLSALVVGKIADSYPTRCYQMMLFGYILSAAAYLFAGPAPFMTSVIPPSVLLTSCGYAFAAFAIAAIINPAPQAIIDAAHAAGYQDGLDTSAMVASLYNAMWFLGSFAGAPIAGFLMDMVGFQWGAFIMAVVALLMTLLLILREGLQRLRKSKQPFGYTAFEDDATDESVI